MKVSEITSRLSQHLLEIGRTTFECPSPRGNHDPLMHEYMIDTQCASHFKKQREKSLKELLSGCDPGVIERAVDDAKITTHIQSEQLLSDDIYHLVLNVKAPGEVLDITKLRSRLDKDGRYTPKEIRVLFNEYTSQRTPAKSFSVYANG